MIKSNNISDIKSSKYVSQDISVLEKMVLETIQSNEPQQLQKLIQEPLRMVKQIIKKNSYSYLMLALRRGYIEILRLLLQNGASFSSTKIIEDGGISEPIIFSAVLYVRMNSSTPLLRLIVEYSKQGLFKFKHRNRRVIDVIEALGEYFAEVLEEMLRDNMSIVIKIDNVKYDISVNSDFTKVKQIINVMVENVEVTRLQLIRKQITGYAGYKGRYSFFTLRAQAIYEIISKAIDPFLEESKRNYEQKCIADIKLNIAQIKSYLQQNKVINAMKVYQSIAFDHIYDQRIKNEVIAILESIVKSVLFNKEMGNKIDEKYIQIAKDKLRELHILVNGFVPYPMITQPMRNTHIVSRLSSKLFIQILDFLDKKSIFFANRVCKEWSKILHDSSLVKYFSKYITVKTLPRDVNTISCITELLDGKLASVSMPGIVKIWDIKRGKCIKEIRVGNRRKSIIRSILSLGHGILVVGGVDLKIWDIRKGACIKTLKIRSLGEQINLSQSLIILQNGQLVSGSDDGIIRIWNIRGGECIQMLRGHVRSVNSLVELQNKQLVSGSSDGTIRIWDIKTRKCIRVFKFDFGSQSVLTKLYHSRFASGGSKNGLIKIWDAEDTDSKGEYKSIRILKGHRRGILCIIRLSNGLLISASNDRALRIWNVDSGECLSTINCDYLTKCFALLKNNVLVSGGDDNNIRIWRSINSLHMNLNRLDKQAYKESFPLIMQARHLRTLDLSNSNIQNAHCEKIAQFITTHPFLEIINLSYNQIKYLGFSYFLMFLSKQRDLALRKINFNGNSIFISNAMLVLIMKKFKHGLLNIDIDLSQNYLMESCTKYFHEVKKEKENIMIGNNVFRYRFFVMSPSNQPVKSVLNSKCYIDQKNWAVLYLPSKKNKEYDEIYLEGLYANGQRFLARYYLLVDKQIGKINVSICTEMLHDFNQGGYSQGRLYFISDIKGKGLRINLKKEQREELGYPCSDEDKKKCKLWALRHLWKIGIEITHSEQKEEGLSYFSGRFKKMFSSYIS